MRYDTWGQYNGNRWNGGKDGRCVAWNRWPRSPSSGRGQERNCRESSTGHARAGFSAEHIGPSFFNSEKEKPDRDLSISAWTGLSRTDQAGHRRRCRLCTAAWNRSCDRSGFSGWWAAVFAEDRWDDRFRDSRDRFTRDRVQGVWRTASDPEESGNSCFYV